MWELSRVPCINFSSLYVRYFWYSQASSENASHLRVWAGPKSCYGCGGSQLKRISPNLHPLTMLAFRGTPLLVAPRVHASLPGLAVAWGGARRHYAGMLWLLGFGVVYARPSYIPIEAWTPLRCTSHILSSSICIYPSLHPVAAMTLISETFFALSVSYGWVSGIDGMSFLWTRRSRLLSTLLKQRVTRSFQTIANRDTFLLPWGACSCTNVKIMHVIQVWQK